MPLIPEVQDYLETVRAAGALPTELQPTVAAARQASLERRRRLMAARSPVRDVQDMTLPGPAGPIPVRCYWPDVSGLLGCVVWLHGGGFVLDGLDGTDAEASRVAVESGCVVVSVDYRLAPEHRFPIGLEDCVAAVGWVLEQSDRLGFPPGQVCVGGISSGANLTAVVTQEMKRRQQPAVRGQILAVGLFDAAMATESWRLFGTGYLLDRSTCEWFLAHYLTASEKALDVRVSPLRSPDVSGLPPALVLTAEYDPLRDEGNAYAGRLAEAGVPVELLSYEGVIHGFIGTLGPIAASEAAFAAIGSFVRGVLPSR